MGIFKQQVHCWVILWHPTWSFLHLQHWHLQLTHSTAKWVSVLQNPIKVVVVVGIVVVVGYWLSNSGCASTLLTQATHACSKRPKKVFLNWVPPQQHPHKKPLIYVYFFKLIAHPTKLMKCFACTFSFSLFLQPGPTLQCKVDCLLL